MELFAKLEKRKAELYLERVPRDMNSEADGLVDGDGSGFDPSLQARASIGNIKWLALGRLLVAGLAFQQEAARLRSHEKRAGWQARGSSNAAKKSQALKEREPW